MTMNIANTDQAGVLNAKKVLAALPPENPSDLLPAIRQLREDRDETIVVLDDDPTGTQTVHDTPVLTVWDQETLQKEFILGTPLFYVLTNSRSLPVAESIALAQQIGGNLAAASRATGRKFIVMSRSDSTLRGHYPAEVNALANAVGLKSPPTLLIPAFIEGGRFTINDIHYVQDGDQLIPAASTPFAADRAFGYRSSNLREYVEEKTNGAIKASDVMSISIEDLRIGGPEKVAGKLEGMRPGSVCVVNAAAYSDLAVFTKGFFMARVTAIFRVAASIVPVVAGMKRAALLDKSTFAQGSSGPGTLIIAGSFVPKTTAQLQRLENEDGLIRLEADVEGVLSGEKKAVELARRATLHLTNGNSVLIYTSRKLIAGQDAEASLAIGNTVSDFLVDVVRNLEVAPRCIIAKGGITSSDIATKALGIKRATVLGQIAPGVPVWRADDQARFRGVPYIVFPGNVGEETLLRDVFRKTKA